MSCQFWKPVLFELARGFETAQTHEALLHARECHECSTLLEEQRYLTQLLQTAASEAKSKVVREIPSNLLAAFRAGHEVSKKSHVVSWVRAAILALAILGGWIWYHTHKFEEPAKTSSREGILEKEDAGEFIPLQYVENPVNSFQVVRVEIGSSELQQLGFPGVPEWENYPVQADIVVGEDGLPHAIRFVNTK